MLAIRAARLFDGEEVVPLDRPTLIVSDRHIADVRPAGDLPPGTELVDLGDATILPGLVDAHTHLAFDASADVVGRLAAASDDEVLDGMRAAARTALAAGITTVRDLGDRGYLALRLRDELAGDPTGGPRVLAAGPPITTTRGHCWYLGGEADGVDGVRAAVQARAERGVDVVKVMATGGELTPGTHSHKPQYGPDELRAIVEEAHRFGLPVTAHAHAGAAIGDAVAAGVDSIEHCTFLSENGVDAQPEIIEELARCGVVVSATLGLLPGYDLPPRVAAMLPALTEVFAQLTKAGVTIVCSSDAGIAPPKPHDVLPYGVSVLVDTLGWPAVRALRAVTSMPARLCGIDDRAGRLAPGYDADVLAVAGDPLADPSALRDVRAVFRQGHRVR
jgi:imidazolonepropionase-like amidohydrolase